MVCVPFLVGFACFARDVGVALASRASNNPPMMILEIMVEIRRRGKSLTTIVKWSNQNGAVMVVRWAVHKIPAWAYIIASALTSGLAFRHHI
jgi:hypothetical protein